jgi:hypothetical protein
VAQSSWRSRFWAYVSAPGVFWWGLPAALTWAVAFHARTYGVQWRSFWSVEFSIILAVAVVFGVIGGNVFGRIMARHGVDLGVLDGKDPEPPPNDH